MEKRPEEAMKYFERRMAVVKEQLDKLSGILNGKRSSYQAITSVLQSKIRDAQSQSRAAAAAG